MGRAIEGPWFRVSKGTWYCTLEGRMVSLKVTGERNRSDALTAWHRLMAGLSEGQPNRQPEPIQTAPNKALSVKQLADAFLEDASARMGKACKRNYTLFLNALTVKHGSKNASAITDADIAVASNPKWSQTYKAGFIGCILTVYRWAVRHERLTVNPITLRKPHRESRGADVLISEATHLCLTAHAEPIMADFLTLLWLTGARPGELTGITAEMVMRMVNGVLPLTEHKMAYKGKGRALILAPDAVAILQHRAEGCTGRLFPWTVSAVTSRVNRLCKRAGVKGVIAYGYRHTFATDALAAGVPDATVAALMGHCDTSMIHRHYSHLSARTGALQDALGKCRGK